jgi:hypothetical protein
MQLKLPRHKIEPVHAVDANVYGLPPGPVAQEKQAFVNPAKDVAGECHRIADPELGAEEAAWAESKRQRKLTVFSQRFHMARLGALPISRA